VQAAHAAREQAPTEEEGSINLDDFTMAAAHKPEYQPASVWMVQHNDVCLVYDGPF
jgi:hypothetical protein